MRQEIWQFWGGVLEEARKFPLRAEVEAMIEGEETWLTRTYRVTLQSLGGIRFSAWFTLPCGGAKQPFPAILVLPGYSGRTSLPRTFAHFGFAVLNLFPRGQNESQRFWRFPEGFTKLTYGLGSPEGHYYKGAVVDCLRGLDFLCQRPEVDPSRIGVYGSSQGGGLALLVAALDRRPKAVAAHVPFLCHFRVAIERARMGPMQELISYLEAHPDQKGKALKTLSFFDPYELAEGIECPTLISVGLKDMTCPPETIFPVFERLRCQKALIVYPELGHAHSFDFFRHATHWLTTYLRSDSILF